MQSFPGGDKTVQIRNIQNDTGISVKQETVVKFQSTIDMEQHLLYCQ